MKKMIKNICAILMCVLTALSVLPVSSMAAVAIDTDAECSLNLTFAGDDWAADSVTFRVYKVADISVGSNFTVVSQFEDDSIEALLEEPSSENYRLLANTLPGVIAERHIDATATKTTDDSGVVNFTGLSTGLYMVTAGSWTRGQEEYSCQNFMVSLPNMDSDGNWIYDQTSAVKWEVEVHPVELQVRKAWSDSSRNTHSSDSVIVDLYCDDTLAETVTLSQDNNWTYTWENLSDGSHWTVRERSVSGYTGAVDRDGNNFVITNTPVTPPSTPGNRLPQTGMLWWPVPILAFAGILLVMIGVYRKRRV